MVTNRTVLIHVGEPPSHVTAAKTVAVDVTSTDAATIVDALTEAGLQPSDFRTRVVTSFDCPVDVAVAVYAALCGFAGRRLDVAGNGDLLTVAATEQLGAAALEQHRDTIRHDRQLTDGVRPLCVQIGATHPELPAWPFTPEGVAAAWYAKRVRYVPTDDAYTTLGQLMVLASVRVKDKVERFPYLSKGDEPVADDPTTVAGIDVDGIRRAALSRRRQMRRDDRSTIVDAAPSNQRQQRLQIAAEADIETTLLRLGATVADGDTGAVWTCPRVQQHDDATPSLRINDGKAQCGRCDTEPLDSLRLVMTAQRMTADEAADWIETAS